MRFCALHRNLRWLPKVAGKQFLREVVSRLCRYPAGPRFCQNRSISHRFQDKCAFIFYTEIKDAAKSGGKAIFCEVASRICIYPAGQKFCRNRCILHRFRDKCTFAFLAEIQDDPQK